MIRNYTFSVLFLFCLTFFSCKKDPAVINGNTPADYSGIATIRVENYINRMYIDLLGRVPLQTESTRDLAWLRANNLSLKSRDSLITRLQTDSTFTPGDSSYRRAYYQRIYDLSKARFMEGASEDEIGEKVGPLYFGKEVARVKGDSIGVFKAQEEIDRYEDISRSNRQYEHHSI
ncbi:MAG: hypothetical protein H7321_07665, partial [Bacteroidia bacterium]|nr:hypothetical protein [Bacteroidia bacterium]